MLAPAPAAGRARPAHRPADLGRAARQLRARGRRGRAGAVSRRGVRCRRGDRPGRRGRRPARRRLSGGGRGAAARVTRPLRRASPAARSDVAPKRGAFGEHALQLARGSAAVAAARARRSRRRALRICRVDARMRSRKPASSRRSSRLLLSAANHGSDAWSSIVAGLATLARGRAADHARSSACTRRLSAWHCASSSRSAESARQVGEPALEEELARGCPSSRCSPRSPSPAAPRGRRRSGTGRCRARACSRRTNGRSGRRCARGSRSTGRRGRAPTSSQM